MSMMGEMNQRLQGRRNALLTGLLAGIVGGAFFNIKDTGAVIDGVTDDTVAVQAAINSVAAAGSGTVFHPGGVCIIAGPLRDTSNSNAQLLLPIIDPTAGNHITIAFLGCAPPSANFNPTSAVTLMPTGGSVFKGTLNSGSGGAMFGGARSAGAFTSILVKFENLYIRMPSNPVLTALNLSQVGDAQIRNVVVDTGVWNIQSVTQPTTTTSYGIRMPGNNNGAHTRCDLVNVIGFYTGVQIGEHQTGDMIGAWGCNVGFEFNFAYHASQIQRLLSVHCPTVLKFTGGLHYFSIDQLDIEHAAVSAGDPAWQVAVYDADDASNYGQGTINWHCVLAATGVTHTFTKNGGTGLILYEVGTVGGAGGGGYASGTSFPGSPSTHVPFYRTDLDLLCFYDGTRWLTVHEYAASGMEANTFPLYTSTINGNEVFWPTRSDYSMYLTRLACTTIVNTTSTGSAGYTIGLHSITLNNVTDTTITSFSTTTTPDTAGVFTRHDVALSTVLDKTTIAWLRLNIVATGSPGTMLCPATIYYRLIVT